MSRLLNSFNKLSRNMAATESARGRTMAAVAVGAGVASGSYILLHTFYINKYRDFVQLYKHGLSKPVSPKIQARIKRVVEDMNIPVRFRAYLSSFYVQGLDPYHMGSLKLNAGAYLGVPGNWDYEKKADIETHLIVVATKPVPWNSEAGDLLQSSIILSDKAQRFAIAREIHHLDTHYVYLNAIIGSSLIGLQYWLASKGNVLCHGHLKSRTFRLMIYGFVGIFTAGIWFSYRDLMRKYYENWADHSASSLGLDYAQGAVEYYTKLVQRNMALRELMGSKGEKLWTKYGNDNELFRQRHVPLSVRKENAEKMVQQLLHPESSTETDKETKNTSKNQANLA